MGDDGFLCRLKSQIRRHNLEDVTLFIDGTVTGKRGEDGACLVDIERRALNQDSELSIRGTGVVALPSRG